MGGWLAQGGAGIGSFEFGWFEANLLSARVVLPSGQVKELSGPDLELVSEAEGTTGLISCVTRRVQKHFEPGLAALACPDAHEITRVFEQLTERRLPIWSVVFINPKMAELKNKAPLGTHHGRPAEPRVILPAAYIARLAFRPQDRDAVLPSLQEILKPCQGEILSDRIARHEWEGRFKLMIVKRLGPSLVPTEVVVPLEKLGEVMLPDVVPLVVPKMVAYLRGRALSHPGECHAGPSVAGVAGN